MTENFSPQEAASALTQANRWEDRLLHRTEGMTWMVWGLVTAGIWVTFSAMARAPMSLAGMTLSWLAWVLSGFALTYALWRSAALVRPDAITAAPWWTYPLKVGAITLASYLLHYVIHPETPAYPLALTGFLWITLAVLGRRSSRLGKLTAASIGTIIVLGGFLLPLAVSQMEGMMLGAALVGGAVPLLGGLYQTLRG